MNFRIRDLQNFMSMAHLNTMSAAAKQLGVSQPTLSESISRLEHDLQQTLFYRTRSGVSLTPSGRDVLLRAESAMTALAEVERSAAKNAMRPIRIGCHPTVGSYFLPRSLELLENLFPDYRIELKHGLSRDVQYGIQNGEIDLGVIVNPMPSPDLIVRSVAQDLVSVWEKRHSTSNKLFCHSELHQTQAILRKLKGSPPDIIETSSLELIVSLVNAGLGRGILPERAVRLLGKSLRRVEGSPTVKDNFALVYRPEFGKTAFERAAIDSIATSISEAN